MASTTAESTSNDLASSDVPIPEPIVKLSKCLIRRYHPSDAPHIPPIANSTRVAAFMTNGFPHPYTLESSYSWLKICAAEDPERPCNFVICDLSNTPIGGIGLTTFKDIEERTVDIGYWLGEASWGKGIMTEAARAFTDWAFRGREEILRIAAKIFEGNVGSEGVLSKAGYVFEGTMRKAVWKNGRSLDLRIWGMTRDDWEKKEGKVQAG